MKKNYTGYAVIMGNKILQIFIRDPRKDKAADSLVEITKTVAAIMKEKFQVKKITFKI